jgi:LAT3 family solute carrier family 43 protein 3
MGRFRSSKYLVVLWSTLETFLCCGVLFGWPNLVKIYKNQNFFQCDESLPNITVTSGASNVESEVAEELECGQEQQLVRAYQYATVVFAALGVVVGIIFDKFGTSATRLTGLVLFILGNIVMIMAESNHSLLYPGLSLIAGSGIFILTCQMQTANLFISSHGRVLTMLNGAMDTSSAASLLLYAIYTALGYKMCFTIYGSLSILILIRTLFFLPKTQIPYPLPDNYEMDPPVSMLPGIDQDCFACFDKTRNETGSDTGSLAKKQDQDQKLIGEKDKNESSTGCSRNSLQPEVPNFFSRDVFFSPLYFTTVLFFMINVFRVYMFLTTSTASTAEIITTSTNATKEEAIEAADSMVLKFGFVQSMGVLFAPINGFVIDKMMMKTNEKYRSLSVSVLCCIALGVCFSTFCLLPFPDLQYLSFVVSVVHRAFTYSVNAAVIAMCFPNIYFGKLYGFSQFATLVSGQLVGSMFDWGSSNGFKKMNFILLILEVSTIFHFFSLLFFARKNSQNSENSGKNSRKNSRTSIGPE